jgi:acetamidase/formamidase
MSGGCVAAIIIVFVVFGIANFVWRTERGGDLLDQWATSNGFSIVSRERRSLVTGPFFFRKGKGQDVYYVTVQDSDGQQRSGYVRLGGMFMGMLSDQVDVKWDQ